MTARRALRLVLALVLCLQSSLALAHCLRVAVPAPHQPFHVEICTPDGVITLDLADREEAPAEHEYAGFCIACHGAAQASLPAPPELPLPTLRRLAPPPLPLHAAAPLSARAPPYKPTGPPRLS
jgi:cytochrome c553